MKNLLFLFPILCIFGESMLAQQVEITITGIRNSRGVIRVGIFKDQESFDKETPFDGKIFPKKTISNGKLTVKFDIPPGKYGFAVLDDEDENGKMTYNFFGIPREGFGFSGDTPLLGKPSFSDFAVDVRKGLNKFTIKMTYVF